MSTDVDLGLVASGLVRGRTTRVRLFTMKNEFVAMKCAGIEERVVAEVYSGVDDLVRHEGLELVNVVYYCRRVLPLD